MTSDPFLGPRLKIERAERHIKEIHAAAKAFRDSNPYACFVDKDEQPGQLIYKLRILKTIPPHFSTIIGDAVQNLRAALDHAACCLALQHKPTVNINDVAFPIAGDAEKFEALAKDKIKKLSPKAIAFIKGLKPYKGGNDAFWQLHRLSIRDRHRLLFPTWAGRGSVGVRIISPHPKTGKPIKSPLLRLNPVGKFHPLEDGAALFTAPVSALGDAIDEDISLQVEIAFGDGEVVIAQPIGPTLVQFREFVEDVIGRIERKFFG